MSWTIHNTAEWPAAAIEPFANLLTEAMAKLCQRFPDDVTIEEIARNIARGEHQLWLILDEKRQFKAFLTTEVSRTERGRKRVNLCQLGGFGSLALVEVINDIEKWARDLGANEICAIGRYGWRKALAKHGYKPVIMKFKKDI